MEKLLKSGLINLSELARQMWPDRPQRNAASLLTAKVRGSNGNTINANDEQLINEVFVKNGIEKIS